MMNRWDTDSGLTVKRRGERIGDRMARSEHGEGRRYVTTGLCLTLVLALACWGAWAKGGKQTSATLAQTKENSSRSAKLGAAALGSKNVVYRNLRDGVRFVGSEACAPCHRKIYEEYLRTPHGQAATLPNERQELHNLPAEGVSVCEKDSTHCFRVFRDKGEYYMSEYDRGPDGAELSRQAEKIAFALGEPMAGVGYGIQRGNYLFEAPLSYYAGSQDKFPQGWGLSPGYEKARYGFDRPLVGSCMYCHVGRSRIVDDANNLYLDPPIAELKVGCENCHGPGELHVEEQRRHVKISGKIDTSVVNPAHLSPRISDDMCTYCHEYGEARIPQPGKKFEDFRPGTPLVDTMAIFKTRPIMGWNMMEWSDEMAQSKCYRASGGRLTCNSCHDGHRTPTAEEAPAFYRDKCLNCHRKNKCSESLAVRQRTKPADNCVACHMPKHVAPRFIMLGTQGTSHRIVAREGEPLPAEAIQDQSPDPTTGLILVNRNRDATDTTLSPLVLLQAYQAVLARSPKRSDLESRYDRLIDQMQNSDPDNPLVLSALAKRELKKQLPQANLVAAKFLSRAVEKGSKSPQDYMVLAELLFRSNRKEEAVDILKDAISRFPYISTPYENLSFCYKSMGDDAHAREVVKTGLGIFPRNPNLLAVQRTLGVSP